MGGKKRRLFLAIPLTDHYTQSLIGIIKKYQQDFTSKMPVNKLRWMPAENWHVTLFFLGKTGEAGLPLLKRQLSALFQQQEPFALRFESVTFAPPSSQKRMIWAQFSSDITFSRLVYDVYESLEENFGLQPPHKKVIPHATLARFKKVPADVLPRLPQPNIERPLPVQYCELWESHLTSKGSVYESVESFTLGETVEKQE